jgi:hypothetical protein
VLQNSAVASSHTEVVKETKTDSRQKKSVRDSVVAGWTVKLVELVIQMTFAGGILLQVELTLTLAV